jgi:hypothetical protein
VALLQSPVALWVGEGPYASLSAEEQASKVTMKEAPCAVGLFSIFFVVHHLPLQPGTICPFTSPRDVDFVLLYMYVSILLAVDSLSVVNWNYILGT